MTFPPAASILVVEPGLHPEFLGLIGAGVGQPEPFVTQVLRHQARAGVHEESTEPHFLHHMHLPEELVLFQLPVPTPERLASVLRTGIIELFE
jgi:hypothetical protein